jgi:cytochrome c-type biogenesis protein
VGELLLSGSALAAFLAGVVAFFAPCCATVMLPSYLATTAGARGWRLVPLTGIYVAGVATVVLPLTVGAAGLASLLSEYHALLFVFGGAMMLAIAYATLAGKMWSVPLPEAPMGTGSAAVYGLGVFAGAATACCAPVLAGAVAISGVSASWWVGALMGGIYLLGLITPLILTAVGIVRLRDRLSDPEVEVSLAGRTLRTTRLRLAAGLSFVVLGALMIVLALSGQAESAPAFQAGFGRMLQDGAGWLAASTPMLLGWAVVAGIATAIVALVLHTHHRDRIKEETP